MTSSLINFIQGPMVWISFLVFGGGLIVQTLRLLKLTRENVPQQIVPDNTFIAQTNLSRKERFFRFLVFQRVSPLEPNICLVLVSIIFHLCLIMTPIFVLGHNVMLDTAFGISFISLPEQDTDIMTKFVLAGALMFIMRRLLLRRVRIISTVNDYLLLLIAVAPFVTGFMVYHHVLSYNTIILLHILSGELMLVTIPFSKFFHMVFFFVSRFMIVSEHSLGKPKRSWHYSAEH